MVEPTVEDEHGVTWLVKAGDPARPLVLELKRRGYRWVVLPFAALLTGDPARGTIDLTERAVSTPPQAHLPPGSGATPDRGGLLRLIRGRECLEVLREV